MSDADKIQEAQQKNWDKRNQEAAQRLADYIEKKKKEKEKNKDS